MAKTKDQEGVTSPDTGKGLAEGSGGELLDQLGQSPEMGAGAEIDDELEVGEGGSPPTDGGGSEIESLMRERGLKSSADLVSLFKNQERKITELGNQNRIMQMVRTFPPPAATQASARVEQKEVEFPDDPSEFLTDREKYKAHVKQVMEVARQNALVDFQEQQRQQNYGKLYRQALVKLSENPEEFERLRPRMVGLSQGQDYDDLDTLYNQAKSQDLEDKRRQLDESLAAIGLSRTDIDQIKGMLGKTRMGQISTAGGGGSPVTGGPDSVKEKEKAIIAEILGAKQGE